MPSPTGLFLTKNFPTLIVTPEEEAEMDRFSLRRILLAWTSFWKKLSNMVVLNGRLTAAALKNMSMRAKRGGRSECLCTSSSKEMDYKLGLHLRKKKAFLISERYIGWCHVKKQFRTLVLCGDAYPHTSSSMKDSYLWRVEERRPLGNICQGNCSTARTLTLLIPCCPASQGKNVAPSHRHSFIK